MADWLRSSGLRPSLAVKSLPKVLAAADPARAAKGKTSRSSPELLRSVIASAQQRHLRRLCTAWRAYIRVRDSMRARIATRPRAEPGRRGGSRLLGRRKLSEESVFLISEIALFDLTPRLVVFHPLCRLVAHRVIRCDAIVRQLSD